MRVATREQFDEAVEELFGDGAPRFEASSFEMVLGMEGRPRGRRGRHRGGVNGKPEEKAAEYREDLALNGLERGYADPRRGGYRQIQEAGGQVRKGEKG